MPPESQRQSIPTVVTRFHRGGARASAASGFTLIEVVIAIGVFAFAILGIIGLMSTGVTISRESVQASTMAQMYREGEGYLATNTNSTNLWFSNEGVRTNPSTAVFQLNITATNYTNDATQGILARNLSSYLAVVVRYPATNSILGSRFIQITVDPTSMRSNCFW